MSENPYLWLQTRTSIIELSSLQKVLDSPRCLHRASIASFDAREQSRRLTLWANNIGALQRAGRRTSLDYRLREAPQVRQQISRLLGRINESTKQASSICQGHSPNRIEDDSDLEDESSSEQYEHEIPVRSSVSEINELCLSITGSITRLFKLSMTIRNPTPRDRYTKLASIKAVDSRYDVAHVKEKFPITMHKLWLAERLGKANSQRRDYFRYRRKHEEKLAEEEEESLRRQLELKGHEEETHIQNEPEEISALRERANESSLGSTRASTFVQLPTTDTTVGEIDENSDTGASETSFATSVEESNSNALRVPQAPTDPDNVEPFICPYCFLVQTPMTRRAWKQHVYSDLRPYVCTFEQCTIKSFSSRREWFDHELRLHRKEWVCSLCDASSFRSSASFRDHLRQKHMDEITGRQLEGMVELCGEPVDKLDPMDCPLCDEWAKSIRERELSLHTGSNEVTIVVTPKQFRRHLAGHLEQLALFSLPRDHGSDGSDGGSNDAVFDTGSDDSSVQPSIADYSDAGSAGSNDQLEIEIAVKQNDIEVVTRLLRDGTDVNAYGKDGNTLLQNAIHANSSEMVNLLLSYGADTNLRSPYTFPIRTAVMSHQINIVQDLLEHGADPNQKDDSGSTSLHYAATLGAINLIRLLYEHSADLNVINSHGETPLMVAQAFSHFDASETIKLLNENQTNNDSPDGSSADESKRSLELEQAALKIQRRWRKVHLERYLPLEPGTLRSFRDVVWVVTKLWRNSQWKADEKFPKFPSQPTAIEKIWGRLYDDSGEATPRFNQFLRGIAKWLIEVYEPRNVVVIEPRKMLQFYYDFQVDDELWPWPFIWDDRTSSISRLLRTFSVEHHLIQEDSHLGERPDIPALTPTGFAKWTEIMLRSNPEVEYRRLSKFVSHCPVSNPDDELEVERFPKELPRRLLPTTTDIRLYRELELAFETHCGINSNENLPRREPPKPFIMFPDRAHSMPGVD